MHSIDTLTSTHRIHHIVNEYYSEIIYRYASLYALFCNENACDDNNTVTLSENLLDELVESISLFATSEVIELYNLLQ
jgi:hypothetical protein